jgi:phospholipase/lecithinase/hemolysin
MIKLSFSMLMRIAALMAACVLVGCGGASSTVNPLTPTRIIAFGDGFSAVDSSGYGTFTVRTSDTDNTVAGRIAAKYSTTPLVPKSGAVALASTGNFSFASGTARAADTATQINNFVTGGNTIGSSDLFIITAGALDIYDVSTGVAGATITSATTSLVNAVKQLTNAGAQYVLIMYPINMARTPWGNGSATIQALSYDTGTSCLSFSCKLTTALNTNYPATSSHNPVLIADLMGYSNLFTGTAPSTGFNSVVTTIPGSGSLNTFASYGVSNPSFATCSTAAATPIASPTTSISCDPAVSGGVGVATGTDNGWTAAAWDYTTSVFADKFNLTPLGNRLLADYIYNYNFYRAGWR